MFRLTPLVLSVVLACDSDKSLTVQNPSPTAEIISHDSSSEVFEGVPTLFIGSVTDSNHTPDQLTTTWSVNGEVICDAVIPDSSGQTECEVALDIDDTEITLAVLDTENARGEDTISVAIVETEAPIAEISSPMTEGVYYSDQKITFQGVVSDAEDDVEDLVVYWESDIDGVLEDVDGIPTSSGEVLGFGNLTEGQHAIQLIVTDTTGKQDQEYVLVTVGAPNSAPLCEITAPVSDLVGPFGSTIQFAGTASDVNVGADWLSVYWESDKDGELGVSTPDSQGNITFAFADLSVNTHTILMKVEDEVGATCTSTIVYTVGTPPSVTIDIPIEGETYSEGTMVDFMATVSDTQDQPNVLLVDWALNGASYSTQGATSSGTAQFSENNLAYGSYNLVVTATDSDGLTDSDQVNFVVNGLPTEPVVSINPDPATTSDGLNVSIDSPSIDPEGAQVTYAYEWQLGGQTQTGFTSSSLPSSATSKGEQWTVVVIPSDGLVDGISGTSIITIQNTPPIISGVVINPVGPSYNDDILTCSATVTDPDETVTPSYEWILNGGVVGQTAVLDLSTLGLLPGETVTCSVLAVDSDMAQSSDSATRTLDNRAPSISASLTTNGTSNAGELTCVGIATDPDGESLNVTYEWFNGGNSLGTTNPLNLNSTMASSGDVVECVATATDLSGALVSDTASQIITNSIPSMTSVILSPDPAVIGVDDLLCTVQGTDGDADPILYTYEWSNSQGVQQTTTLVSDVSDVFLSAGLNQDDWICTVTPYDGIDYGMPLSDTVTVENSCWSLDFDGVNDYLTTSYTTAFNDITVEAWVKVSQPHSNYMRIVDIDEVFQDYFMFGLDPYGYPTLLLRDDANDPLELRIPQSVVDDQWHHMAWVRNGTQNELYLDGQLGASDTYSAFQFVPVGPMYIGFTQYSGASDQYFTGLLNGVRVSSSPLYSTNFTPPLQFQNTSDTLVNVDLDVNSVLDSSGNNYSIGNQGATLVPTCLFDDVDGDGIFSWEDCDDTDATIPSINDQDCDGYTISDGDCDDSDAAIHPFAGDVYDDGIDSDCDGMDFCEGFESYGVYYAACYDPQTWSDAHTVCQNTGYDGLATIVSAQENDFMLSLLPENPSDATGIYWIGLTDMNSEGNYSWVSGYGVTYVNWAAGEPNNINNEDCAHIYSDGFSTLGQWNDHVCSTQSSYVCEYR